MCRSLLNDEKFVDGVALHLVKKLADTEKKITQTHQKPVGENEQIIRMTQLLEGLSVLCACKGKPLKSNQRMLHMHYIISFHFCCHSITEIILKQMLKRVAESTVPTEQVYVVCKIIHLCIYVKL